MALRVPRLGMSACCHLRTSYFVPTTSTTLPSQWHQKQRFPGRHLTTRTALQLLGLPREHESSLTLPQLRQAYFAAAKRCHPDVVQTSSEDNNDGARKKGDTADFLQLTAAYEHLSQSLTGLSLPHTIITVDEETAFRNACDVQLGVPAEIVEECKRSPLFRRWLAGRTDAAHTWRNFLTQNGGLAPKLARGCGAKVMITTQTALRVGDRCLPIGKLSLPDPPK